MFIRKKILMIVLSLIIILSISGCTTENQLNGDENLNNDDESTLNNESGKIYSTLLIDDYNGLKMDELNNYDISLEFNPDSKTYTAEQKIRYINNEDVSLEEIYFHLYPNTFRKKETAPFLFDSFESAFPNGFDSGYIDISEVSINQESITNFETSGTGETILKIPLISNLEPKKSVEISMKYTVKLPSAQDRFGYGQNTFNFGNWYPIAAVYDDEGWNLDPYYSIGDPFYSDTSNYNVTIKAPKDIKIASSGNITSEKVQGDSKIWNIEAKLMRDFAWVASKDFKVIEKDVDGTLVQVYVLKDNESINNYAAEAAFNSIEIFNRVFGKYPYGQYSVVATSFPSGMEYPGIVFIGEKYYNNTYKGYLETVIVHETGHQWWYSLVGNDEVDEAWLDESITSYSEVIYADEKYGDDTAETYYKSSTENSYNSIANSLTDKVVLKKLSEFTNWDDYGALAYNRGAMFIHEIEERYGEETLYRILNEYYNKYKFLNATTDDFVEVCEEITGQDFEPLVDEFLYGK
ncbi:M1 family metallopeptidase [Sporosalibacterium faouarense]|uniref:M1 family metallopeptidase n=1 Tax=Sporosalibacterium faouarense TaxID=516123 RepID=UPI00192C7C24|nr:M1 family metallopeptidase [Sporosalibacterium faouarense]